MNKTVLVCQNRTCKFSGSLAVLEALKSFSIPDLTVIGSGCLGQCGNGPMVLILPEEIWYERITPHDVKILVEQHSIEE